jgi:hypothetical protein
MNIQTYYSVVKSVQQPIPSILLCHDHASNVLENKRITWKLNTNITYKPQSPVKPPKQTHVEILQEQLHVSTENSKDLYATL